MQSELSSFPGIAILVPEALKFVSKIPIHAIFALLHSDNALLLKKALDIKTPRGQLNL